MKLKTLIFIGLIAFLPLENLAEVEKEPNRGKFSFFLENDLFAGTDRGYTNGVRLAYVSPNLSNRQKRPKFPGWLDALSRRLSLSKNPQSQRYLSLSIGQNIYTPSDIKISDLIEDDRPYAGITYIGVGFHSRNPRYVDSFGFLIGIVGPHSFAEESQKIIHKIFGGDDPNGWGHQLKNELALGLFYDRKWKLFKPQISKGFSHDMISHIGCSFGNVITAVNTGIEVRAGWNIPDDFSPFIIRPGGESLTFLEEQDCIITREKKFGIYGFVSTEGHAVLRNIFLDGNTLRASHKVDKKPLIADIVVGVALNFRRFRLTYAYVYQTKQFKTQRKNHIFGAIHLSLSY